MIIIFKEHAPEEKVNTLIAQLQAKGFAIHQSQGMHTRLIGLIGDTTKVNENALLANEVVEQVKRIQEPYKNANRKFHPQDTVIDVKGRLFGGGHFQVISGPCSVESEEQILEVAQAVRKEGVGLLRGGAFKPRTSPYSFQGMGAEGLELLRLAREKTGMPIVSEIMDASEIPLFEDVDIIQVGARNMQNFELLKKLGHLHQPILLKRGLANTLEELLMSAEYIMAGGNEQVILCERGIRTFETATRNTLDISAIPMLKKMTHLPVVVDPSHAAGITWMVEPLSLAAIAAGADGLIIEVHPHPETALSDGAQSLTPAQFQPIIAKIKKTAEFFGRQLG